MTDPCKHCLRCKDGACDLCSCCGKCQKCGQQAAPAIMQPPVYVPYPVYPAPPNPYPYEIWWGSCTIDNGCGGSISLNERTFLHDPTADATFTVS